MKYIKFFGIFVPSFFVFAAFSMEIPQEIQQFYSRPFSWVEDTQKEAWRENLQWQILCRKFWKPHNHNSRDCNFDDIFGDVSPLFAISHDDELCWLSVALMNEGASPNYATSTLHTPFERAIRSNALKTAWRMLPYGADCKKGLSVLLDHACYTKTDQLFNAQAALFTQILARLKDANYQDASKQTALMKILQVKGTCCKPVTIPLRYREFYVKKLLEKKAEVLLIDRNFESALDKAEKSGFPEISAILRERAEHECLFGND